MIIFCVLIMLDFYSINDSNKIKKTQNLFCYKIYLFLDQVNNLRLYIERSTSIQKTIFDFIKPN